MEEIDADKMFKDLDYIRHQDEEIIWYQKRIENTVYEIIFDLKEKKIYKNNTLYNDKKSPIKKDGITEIEEFKAIVKKAQELSWIKGNNDK